MKQEEKQLLLNEDIDKVARELYEHLYELKRRNNIPTNLYDKQEIIDLWKSGIEYAYNHLKREQLLPHWIHANYSDKPEVRYTPSGIPYLQDGTYMIWLSDLETLPKSD